MAHTARRHGGHGVENGIQPKSEYRVISKVSYYQILPSKEYLEIVMEDVLCCIIS